MFKFSQEVVKQGFTVGLTPELKEKFCFRHFCCLKTPDESAMKCRCKEPKGPQVAFLEIQSKELSGGSCSPVCSSDPTSVWAQVWAPYMKMWTLSIRWQPGAQLGVVQDEGPREELYLALLISAITLEPFRFPRPSTTYKAAWYSENSKGFQVRSTWS